MTNFTFNFTPTQAILNWQEQSSYPCPDRGSLSNKIHQVVERKVDDPRIDEVLSVRMKCINPQCSRKTFTVHPQGVRQNSPRTVQAVLMTATLYLLGLSYDKVNTFRKFLNLEKGSKSTFWRDVQLLGESIQRERAFISGRERKPVVILGQDGTYIKIRGEDWCLIVNTDLSPDNQESSTFLSVEINKSETARAYRQALNNLVKQGLNLSNLDLIVSDDAGALHKEIEQLNGLDWDDQKLQGKPVKHFNDQVIKHQVCLAHAKKNVTKRLNKFLIKYLQLEPDILKRQGRKRKIRRFHWTKLIKTLPPPLKEILQDLKTVFRSNFAPAHLTLIENLAKNKEVHKHKDLKRFVFALWDKYAAYGLYQTRKDAPATNNATERVNGRSKIRYKLCRGLKSKAGAVNFFLTTQLFEAKMFNEMAGLIARTA